MNVINDTDATGSLSQFAHELKDDPLVVLHKGNPVAILLPVKNADLESVSLSFNEKFLKLIERSRASYYREGGISSDEMRRRLGIPKKAPRKRPAKAQASKSAKVRATKK